MKKIIACILALSLCLVSFSLTACIDNRAYESMTYDRELGRMVWNNVVYTEYTTLYIKGRGDRLKGVKLGKQVGIVGRGGKLYEIKGYPADEWVIATHRDLMDFNYTIYRAETVWDIPPDIAINKRQPETITYDKEYPNRLYSTWKSIDYINYAIIYPQRGQGLLGVEPGEEIGVDIDRNSKVFKLKGYPENEWLITYFPEEEVYYIYMAESVVDVPPDIALNVVYAYPWKQ